jgi:methylenetetrahydrofolate dehydrogenase (NADP+)/methenyltetrahydrofolate cyclohydrolase
MPLPKHINEARIINAIEAHKDVDGLNIYNAGLLFKGDKSGLRPCTPAGVIELILSTGLGISGKEAVVVGRSILVGKPVAMMLLEQQATVTICNWQGQDDQG